MGVTIDREEGDLRVLRITGLLRKSEFDAALEAEARQWGPTTYVKVLVIVENFRGWERGVDWGDMTFFETQGDRIDKIAIVADPQLETDLLMFAGAGFRRAPVKFFSASQLASARAWLGCPESRVNILDGKISKHRGDHIATSTDGMEA